MYTKSLRPVAALRLTIACTACAPIQMSRYEPEATQGKPLYSACAINKNVPDGIELESDGLHALVDAPRINSFSGEAPMNLRR